MKNLQVGDHVLCSGQVVAKKIHHTKSLEVETFVEAIECLFLGWSTVYEGETESDSDYSEWSGASSWLYFVPSSSKKVAKLQRLNYKVVGSFTKQ